MPCFHPLTAWRTPSQQITFDKKKSIPTTEFKLPCGRCIGCRLERSRQWAMRCMHEAKSFEDNCFITLTYSDHQVPEGHSLVKADFQYFMRKLRKRYSPKKIRFYQCGEYGDQTSRPHYHACLFNHDFKDKKLWSEKNGLKTFTSEALSELWDKGFSTVSPLTFELAAYAARYVLKKINGTYLDKRTGKVIDARQHYEYVDVRTGEIHDRLPEYTTMSLKPGIAKKYFEEFGADVYPSDTVIARGFPSKPPRYYDKQIQITDPTLFKEVQDRRKKKARNKLHDQTPERLKVREKVAIARAKQSKRSL